MSIRRYLCLLLTCLLALAVPALSFASANAPSVYSDGDSGEMVLRIQIRLRELGYLPYRPTGVYRGMTVEAVKAFQESSTAHGSALAVDGVMGPESIARLFDPNAPRVTIPDSVRMPRGPVAPTLKAKGQLLSWSDVKAQLASGSEYTVTDCNTGEKFRLVFTGGENHAEMELFSSEDKAAFDAVCGDEYNFLKRPVTVNIGGVEAAASMQCMPHGADSVSNNGMDGHICVFFSGSLSHAASLPDIEHEATVRHAAGQ